MKIVRNALVTWLIRNGEPLYKKLLSIKSQTLDNSEGESRNLLHLIFSRMFTHNTRKCTTILTTLELVTFKKSKIGHYLRSYYLRRLPKQKLTPQVQN